jgi:hypothetical protein
MRLEVLAMNSLPVLGRLFCGLFLSFWPVKSLAELAARLILCVCVCGVCVCGCVGCVCVFVCVVCVCVCVWCVCVEPPGSPTRNKGGF